MLDQPALGPVARAAYGYVAAHVWRATLRDVSMLSQNAAEAPWPLRVDADDACANTFVNHLDALFPILGLRRKPSRLYVRGRREANLKQYVRNVDNFGLDVRTLHLLDAASVTRLRNEVEERLRSDLDELCTNVEAHRVLGPEFPDVFVKGHPIDAISELLRRIDRGVADDLTASEVPKDQTRAAATQPIVITPPPATGLRDTLADLVVAQIWLDVAQRAEIGQPLRPTIDTAQADCLQPLSSIRSGSFDRRLALGLRTKTTQLDLLPDGTISGEQLARLRRDQRQDVDQATRAVIDVLLELPEAVNRLTAARRTMDLPAAARAVGHETLQQELLSSPRADWLPG